MIKNYCLSAGILMLAGCGPSFKSEGPGRGNHVFLAMSIETIRDLPKDALLLVESSSAPDCSQGVGMARARLAQSNASFTRIDVTAPCSRLRPATSGDILRVNQLSQGYSVGQELAAPRKPMIGGRRNGVTLFFDSAQGYYLKYNKTAMQVIEGSYGNREGLEVEYCYEIIADEDGVKIVTLRFRRRIVALESFVEW